MKRESIEPMAIALSPEIERAKASITPDSAPEELRSEFAAMPFVTAYDFARSWVAACQDPDEALEKLSLFDSFLSSESDGADFSDLHTALVQISTGLLLQLERYDEAEKTAAQCLTLLADRPKRRDEPFLSVLAALLYDIARLHTIRGEHRQAEREIEKSAKIYERLARVSPERYGPAHLLAVAAVTKVFRSRVKQANMLAHFHNASETYFMMMNSGVEGAASKLVDSLSDEGMTLAKMGRHREAVQYFTRALKYLRRIEPEMDRRQLDISVRLGSSLLASESTRQKGVHLLNTLLHIASRLNAEDTHCRIVEILADSGGSTDILSFWHKIFPR